MSIPKKLEAEDIDQIEIEEVGVVTKGMVLEHPNFGIGEVEGIYKFIKDGRVTIRINFEQHGSKALVPEYAKLKLPKQSKNKQSLLSKLFGKK